MIGWFGFGKCHSGGESGGAGCGHGRFAFRNDWSISGAETVRVEIILVESGNIDIDHRSKSAHLLEITFREKKHLPQTLKRTEIFCGGMNSLEKILIDRIVKMPIDV